MSTPFRTLAFAAMLMVLAANAGAEPAELFPPATASCYVGAEVTPVAAGVAPYRKPAVPVSTVRLERGYPQLAQEQSREPSTDGKRRINLRVIVTFADSGKPGAVKRYSSGPNELLVCADESCDAGNFRVERQPDGAVLLRMTGGLYIGGGAYRATTDRHLPDGHVYRLIASPIDTCR